MTAYAASAKLLNENARWHAAKDEPDVDNIARATWVDLTPIQALMI
jgi:hypothetical protein